MKAVSERIIKMLSGFIQDEPEENLLNQSCMRTGRVLPDTGTDLCRIRDVLTEMIQREEFLLPEGKRKTGEFISEFRIDAAKAEFDTLGIEMLSYGSFRITFRMGDWVIKCLSHSDFKEAASDEFVMLEHLSPRQKRNFPEMYMLNDHVTLQRYYEIDYDRYYHQARSINNTASKLGVSDLKPENIGWDKNGNFVFIDFTSNRVNMALLRQKDKLVEKNTSRRVA